MRINSSFKTWRLRLATLVVLCTAMSALARPKWTVEQANQWYTNMPWLVGCNFGPSNAINQLEMWQADTFDPATIDKELALAEGLGFNSVRVFLHNLLWEQDKEGFLKRMDQFLGLCEKHRIGVMFVLLDSVWDPFPKSGKQRDPKPHLHNSGWVQSPGLEILKDPKRHDELEPYIKGVITRFRNDPRVQVWDLINEPDNRNQSSYSQHEPANKEELALMLMRKVFGWARDCEPTQPLTSGVWIGDWTEDKLSPSHRFMLEESDIITYHDYNGLDKHKARVDSLRRYNRPMLCTEYMARPNGSTFAAIMPYLKQEKIGAYNWGFVAGKTQTIYPWDSWRKEYKAEPPVWFHDIFRQDGSVYDQKEVDLIRRLTGKQHN